MSRSMVRDILQDGKALLTSDAATDEQWKPSESVRDLDVHGAIGAPLFDNDRILGAIYLDSSTKEVTYRDEDLQLLTILANMAAVKITNTHLEEERQKLARLRHELILAAGIQRNLLPSLLPDVESYQIFAHLDPCEEIGGDLYDVRTCQDGRLWLVVGDVTGHGIGAALLMSHVMAGLRILEDECTDPSVMLDRLESYLDQQMDVGQFVTMFAGILDPASGRLEYVNAGHPPPILLTKGDSLSLGSTGPPVAILPGTIPRERVECVLESDSTLVVYSDGVSDIARDKELYGEGPMRAFLDQAHSLEAEELVRGLLNDAMKFGRWEPVGDDLTLMAVKRM